MKRMFLISILFVSLASLSWAQNDTKRPNFSGTWKLNIEKSEFGGLPAPSSWIQTIKHQGASFEIARTLNGKTEAPITVEIGGKEVSLNMECCGAATTKFWWEKQALLSELKWESGTQKDVRTLSEDGKAMIDNRTIKEQEREVTLKLVFEKQ